MKRFLFALLQCTWGLPQTLAGLAVFLWCRRQKRPASLYHGAVVTRWGRGESLSLGLFVFVTENPPGPAALPRQQKAARLLVHEYGHCVQSLFLGPLYLPVIAAPSGVWCNSRRLQRRRRERNLSYYSFYTERWANALAERVLGEESPGME